MMSFMLISDPPCLSLQSSKECRALHSMAADCCSRVKHACSRNVKVQSSFFSIKIHKESWLTPKMVKMFLVDHFRKYWLSCPLSFLLFHIEERGKCESETKAFPTCSGVDDGSGPVCIPSL